MTTPGQCDNCARPDPDLVAVHRVYLSPETVVDEVELWCWSCRTQYPHEPAD